jgi:hypothetical protein
MPLPSAPAVDAVHANGATEYDAHNLFGASMAMQHYQAMVDVTGKRPFLLTRCARTAATTGCGGNGTAICRAVASHQHSPSQKYTPQCTLSDPLSLELESGQHTGRETMGPTGKISS